MDSKICIGTRYVLWTAEMPFLGDTHFYLVHHILSLSSVGLAVFKSADLRIVYLIGAGLITELLSSSRAFIRGSGLHHSHPKLFARITITNAAAILLLRALPSIYLLRELFRPALATDLGLALFSTLAFYTCFVTYIAYKLFAGQGYVSFQSTSPAHFVFKIGEETSQVSVYSLLLGAAMASAQLLSASLYEWANIETLPQRELSSLAGIGLGTVISGLFGAKYMNRSLSVSTSPSMEQQKATSPLPASPGISRRFFPGFKGISIQGAILFSATWLNLCPILGFKVNSRLLFCTAGLSLPAGEAIGRVGCYFAGCCGSTRREKYPGIQLLSATLNMIVFGSKMLYLSNHGNSRIGEAGLAAVLGNGVVRFVLNPLRTDSARNPFSPASAFALVQILLSSSLLALEKAEGGMDPYTSFLATFGEAASNIFVCRAAAFAWKIAVAQLQKRQLSRFARIDNFVYVFSVAIVLLSMNSNTGDEVARTGKSFVQKEPLFVMSSPALLGSVAAAAGFPIILLN
ncbi:Prolipoprotein diacylglyceryl transferase [Akanthomyces lecanii RCEF 1005]|uniref:Prolipoprotein diacylglyceryl transferase n=1 Tax=Akanthomyces lecanii RCEF 1005 TaxID=1081108 RepID=A0A168EY91_CORDF|nr:Prolipoprotein diacylglyceryl transferase [Akanthomyces lecanii RCEF 1005]